jgi:predicted transcriptional regulator
MAINLRIPAELDARLEELATREHTSKHALILQGVEGLVRDRGRRDEIDRAVDYVLDHDAQLLTKLADA